MTSIGFSRVLFGKCMASTVTAIALAFVFMGYGPSLAEVGVASQPIDRPYSMRLNQPLVLERQIAASMERPDPMHFIFPALPNEPDALLGRKGRLDFQDSLHQARLRIDPDLGYEFRFGAEKVHAYEGGLFVSGYRGPLAFRLDARMFTEMHEDAKHASYDREFIEKQDEAASGSVTYTSYSRYRAEMSYASAIGRIGTGRETPHWGPSLYNNLVFNRDAIPFHQLFYQTQVGPITVISLYGQLQVEENLESANVSHSRSVYAHRYEWALGGDWLFGINEQLILYSYEEPFAFLPILPLFIFKGTGYERLNNGNIAGDVNWRLANWGRIYGEFLIDDIQSPTSLFDDNWGNKWAVTGGLQWVLPWKPHLANKPVELQAISEVTRIEPWVYTHYKPGTAQALNRGYPLGNQLGPDAWAFDVAGIASSGPWVFGIRYRKGEKGGSEAANVQGSPPRDINSKHFLAGTIKALGYLALFGSYDFKLFSLQSCFALSQSHGDRVPQGWLGVRWQ